MMLLMSSGLIVNGSMTLTEIRSAEEVRSVKFGLRILRTIKETLGFLLMSVGEGVSVSAYVENSNMKVKTSAYI